MFIVWKHVWIKLYKKGATCSLCKPIFIQFQSGLSEKDLQEVRLKVPLEMFTEVKDHLSHGGNPNKENENGITLVRYIVESLEFVVVKQIFVDLVGHPNWEN